MYAHLEVVRITESGSARKLNADAAKLCANCPDDRRPDINLPLFARGIVPSVGYLSPCPKAGYCSWPLQILYSTAKPGMTDGTTVLYLCERIDGTAILTRPKVTLRFRHRSLLASFFLKRTIFQSSGNLASPALGHASESPEYGTIPCEERFHSGRMASVRPAPTHDGRSRG